ncbi:MAG: glycosyltransferase [Acidobacteriota bacterium]
MNLSDVTLVIPVRNEEATIGLLWDSIKSQTRQPARVIFVDGGSHDQTVTIIRHIAAREKRVLLIETDGAMPGEGRNIGISAATTEWVALTDAGISLNADWLEQLVERQLEDDSPDVVYGTYDPMIRSHFEECAAIAYVPARWSSQATNGRPFRGPMIFSTLLRRRVWSDVGGFPHWRAAEDLIFMRKVEKAGFKIGYAPGAVVTWQLCEDLSALFRKFKLYSTHNVWAGMQAHWHYGIARHYLLYAVCILLGLLAQQPLLLASPLLGYIFRAEKSLYRKREFRFNRPFLTWAANPLRLGLVIIILMAIDLATFSGWLVATREQKGRKLSQ